MGRQAILIGIVIAALAAAGAGGWYYLHQSNEAVCGACQRPVHHHSRTVGLVDGKRQVFCCPSCALSEVRQTVGEVTVTQLTDFESGKAVAPGAAYIVQGSHINPCLDHGPHVSSDSQPLAQHFDRCAPSALTFATRSAAAAFSAKHGGRVVTFQEMMRDAEGVTP